MTELVIRPVGEGLGVELPHDVIDHLQVEDGDRIFLVKMLDGSFYLAPHDEALREQMLLQDGLMHEQDA